MGLPHPSYVLRLLETVPPLLCRARVYSLRAVQPHCALNISSYYAHRNLRCFPLPLGTAQLGTVYRYERSGALNGLFRVRGFTQDDAHIFCLPSQLTAEILGVLELTERILSKFGFTEYEVGALP